MAWKLSGLYDMLAPSHTLPYRIIDRWIDRYALLLCLVYIHGSFLCSTISGFDAYRWLGCSLAGSRRAVRRRARIITLSSLSGRRQIANRICSACHRRTDGRQTGALAGRAGVDYCANPFFIRPMHQCVTSFRQLIELLCRWRFFACD